MKTTGFEQETEEVNLTLNTTGERWFRRLFALRAQRREDGILTDGVRLAGPEVLASLLENVEPDDLCGSGTILQMALSFDASLEPDEFCLYGRNPWVDVQVVYIGKLPTPGLKLN